MNKIPEKFTPGEIGQLTTGGQKELGIILNSLKAPQDGRFTVRGISRGTDARGGTWITTARSHQNGARTENIVHTTKNGDITVTATVLQPSSK